MKLVHHQNLKAKILPILNYPKARHFMRKKIPPVNGKLPNQTFDLDNTSHLQQLGLSSQAQLKIADNYVHYTNCRFAVLEFKSSTIGKGIKQLETTVERLTEVGKKVDLAIIEIDRLNTYEKRIYKRTKNRELANVWNDRPIAVFGNSVKVFLYFTEEVDRMYRERLS